MTQSILHELNEAATQLRICRTSLDTLIANGEIPVIRVTPRRVFIAATDLQAFVVRQRETRECT